MTKGHLLYRMLRYVTLTAAILLLLIICARVLGHFESQYSSDSQHIDASYFEKSMDHCTWEVDSYQGFQLSRYQKNEINKAYVSALDFLYTRKARTLGLESEHVQDDLLERCPFLENESVDIDGVHLSHNLSLLFISDDKNLISLSDKGALLKTRTSYKAGGISFHDVSRDYEVVMRLTDGRWKMTNIRISKERSPIKSKSSTAFDSDLGPGINYYPAENPWRLFWAEYDSSTTVSDMRLIKELGYKHIRFFIPFEETGGASPTDIFLENLQHFVSTARAEGIHLVPTLFDFPVGFSLDKYRDYAQHLHVICTALGGFDNIVLWDLKNEPDIDFNYHKKEDVLAFLQFAALQLRDCLPDAALTISWAHPAEAHQLQEYVDVISYHHYDPNLSVQEGIELVKSSVKGEKPLYVSEFGKSSFTGLAFWRDGIAQQKQHNTSFITVMEAENIHYALWCLYDYEVAPTNVFGIKPWIRFPQKYFGLVDTSGTLK